MIETANQVTLKSSSLAWARGPRIRELQKRDREFLLARNHVARIAFMGNGRIELLPIHYVFVEGALVGRTALGTKYVSWLTRNEVVVEIDESKGLFDWRSVVVRGSLTLLRAHGSGLERAAYARALEAIRTLVPSALTARDPTPQRGFVFVISPREVTGREATPR
jgi:nitroimidazol reductase NimA-like FMN-containing flavoprotein (pyridoxamine 5'-phosphate oxidase superfamily)